MRNIIRINVHRAWGIAQRSVGLVRSKWAAVDIVNRNIVFLLAMSPVFPVLAYSQEGWHAVFGFFVLPALIIFGGGGLYWWFVERHHNS